MEKLYTNVHWKLTSYLQTASWTYSTDGNGTLTYSNIFPLNTHLYLLRLGLENNYGISTSSITIGSDERSFVINNIQHIYNNKPTNIVLFNNTFEKIEYIDVFTLYQVESVTLTPNTISLNVWQL